MEQIEFQVGAKAARLIGRENIADVDGALIELIKNSYDADASCVYVEFIMPFPDIPVETNEIFLLEQLCGEDVNFVLSCYNETEDGKLLKKQNLPEDIQEQLGRVLFKQNRIIVADNGTGMSKETVKSSWMYIGTSNKEENIRSEKGRIKTGAKGIGRFALDKLSTQSFMYTKMKDKDETIHWRMNWDQFAKAKLIGDVKAELDVEQTQYSELIREMLYDDLTLYKAHDWSTGTMIVLSPIREAWSERLFNKVNTNLKSINPIGSIDKFQVVIKNTFYPEFNFQTKEVAIDKEDYDYRIKVEYDGRATLKIHLLRNEVDLSKRFVTIEKYGEVRRKSFEEFWSREKMQIANYKKEDYNKEIFYKKDVRNLLPKDSLEKIQKVGPFSAEMYFLRNANNEYAIMKQVAVRKRRSLLNHFSGIKLYRDNFKVRPYGDEGAMYDWIGMSERVQKSPAPVAHKTGSWRVQPYQMIGFVKIGRETNPYLEDMANREGIALTDTYYIFVNLLQESLKEFEHDRQYIYREYAKWVKSIEDEIADYIDRIKEEALRRAQRQTGENEKNLEDRRKKTEIDETSDKKSEFSEDEMFNTVYKMMQDAEKELNSKQLMQVLSSSGILLNTFFHEFNAINTQFHVEAPQIRSRINYILKGEEYEGIPAYNPYNRIATLEENDRLTASFLDVIMDGLRKKNLKIEEISLRAEIMGIIGKWSVLLGRKNISVEVFPEKDDMDDHVLLALVDLYIILNNFILNSAWFLEKEYNECRKIFFTIKESKERIHLLMEDNGPGLPDQFKDNPNRIFEIGETSKGEKGTGLGLWVVRETVERYDGLISVIEKEKGFGLDITWSRPERMV